MCECECEGECVSSIIRGKKKQKKGNTNGKAKTLKRKQYSVPPTNMIIKQTDSRARDKAQMRKEQ